MKIETKYNVEEDVWVLHNHKIIAVSVYQIQIDLRKDFSEFFYYFFPENGNECIIVKESRVFKIKKDLINAL